MIPPSTTELPSRSSRTTGNARDANSPRINSTGRNIVTGLPAGDSRRSDGSIQGERLRADRHGGASLFFGGNLCRLPDSPAFVPFYAADPCAGTSPQSQTGTRTVIRRQANPYGGRRTVLPLSGGVGQIRTPHAVRVVQQKSAPKNGRRQCSH